MTNSQRGNRRGAIVVMVALMMVVLMAICAIAIDFSRLWSLRNELQTSADAGAHAGAIQLIAPRITADASDSAYAYAHRNHAMQDTVSVDSLTLGRWDPSSGTFTAGGTPTDAISVVVSRQSTGLIMTLLGVPAPRIKARAIGWADAPVATTGCIKPWAIPMVDLMAAINTHRGIANTLANLTRPFDQDSDMVALQQMTDAERTFSLKIGSGQLADTISTGNLPGNYQAVQLPKLWDADTQTYPTPGPVPGANEYRDNISGHTCYGLSVGDSLTTQPGNMTQPTVNAALLQGSPQYGICSNIVGYSQGGDNTPDSDPTFGDCVNAQGGVGVDVKSAFYMCSSACTGQSTVQVTMLGSFTLKKVFPKNSGPNAYANFQMAQLVGVFNPVQDNGPVGGASTTLQKPILVR